MKLSELQFVFSRNIARLIDYIYASDYTCTVGEFYRTPEQAEIYAKNGKGIRDSQHCKKLAADLNIFSLEGKYLTESEDYQQFGKYWKSLNVRNRWGGDFSTRSDGNHFEMYDRE
jgi:hypothetical protein